VFLVLALFIYRYNYTATRLAPARTSTLCSTSTTTSVVWYDNQSSAQPSHQYYYLTILEVSLLRFSVHQVLGFNDFNLLPFANVKTSYQLLSSMQHVQMNGFVDHLI
jgi:hypothetical protein